MNLPPPQNSRIQHGERQDQPNDKGGLLQSISGKFPSTQRLGSDGCCEGLRDRIVIAGQVWQSQQNGMVYDIRGLSPTITVGNHSGVEPKISVVYESD